MYLRDTLYFAPCTLYFAMSAYTECLAAMNWTKSLQILLNFAGCKQYRINEDSLFSYLYVGYWMLDVHMKKSKMG